MLSNAFFWKAMTNDLLCGSVPRNDLNVTDGLGIEELYGGQRDAE